MNFVYGVSASLISTALSTLGLNLQAASLKEKSEFTMNVSLPSTPTLTSPASIMRKQNKRLKMNTLKWYLGFTMYLFFQTLGSVVGLSFIPATVLAPLGAAGLIFNILFSRIFLGTLIHRQDIIGTSLIVIGCVLIALFATSAPDTHQTIQDLMRLFSRPFFILFFTLQIICTFLLFVYTFWLKRVSVELRTVRDGRSIQLDDSQRISFSERYRKKRLSGMNGLYNRKENEVIELCAEDTDNEAEDVNDRIGYLEDMPLIDYTEDHDINLEDNQEDMILHAQDIIEYTSGARVFETEVFSSIQNEKSNLLGTLFAIIGGIFSSHGMILAKSGVGLVITSITKNENQFASFLPVFIVTYLAITIVVQLYAFNQSLVYSIPTVVFPLSYSVAAFFSLLNSLVYLDQLTGVYTSVQFGYLVIGLVILLKGVWILRERQ